MTVTKPIETRPRPKFPLAVLLVLILLALGVGDQTTSLIISVLKPQTFSRDYRTEIEVGGTLDATDLEIRRRIDIKEILIQKLIAREVSLAEVTERFLELNGSSPTCMTMIRQNHAGHTDVEKTARNVISFAVCGLSRTDPIYRAVILARLESELQSLVGISPATQQ